MYNDRLYIKVKAMALFFEFLIENWILAAAWMTLVYLLLAHESRKAGKSILPQQLSQFVNKEEGLVLDVRDNSEFKQGHIVGSVNIPFRDLEKRMIELNGHKDKPVIVVCKIGHTASSASKQLKQSGFNHVYKLGGGLSEWIAANLPLGK